MADNGRDLEIIKCLLTTRTHSDAAKCANCGERTIYRRLADPTFKAALQAAQNKILAETTAELERLALASTRRLWSFIEKETTEDKAALRAIGLALSHAIRYRETTDLQQLSLIHI